MGTHDAAAALPVLGWVFTGVLLLIILISRAAGDGRIPPNGTIGIRIPQLQRSDAAWAAGHAAGVRPAAIACCAAAACSLLGLFTPVAYWGAIAAFAGGLTWVLTAAVRAANSA
ncbi:hypothetical protein [Sinomonas albida]|uniref:hypothetical protein n=1 Tax=Sinomonas albida TaxID=369942 RepID=UPI0010A7FDF5|nr:hypothetical protein [Sinomonas albida]